MAAASDELTEIQKVAVDEISNDMFKLKLSLNAALTMLSELKSGKISWNDYCESDEIAALADHAEDLCTTINNFETLEEMEEGLEDWGNEFD